MFDVIIVGGGHAGVEAAAAASRLGVHVAFITHSKDSLARLSCNPAMGGTAKGQLIKEIDALGGVMSHATDLAAIQYRMLNRSKGPAVWSPRAQVDRDIYTSVINDIFSNEYPDITFIEDSAQDIITENGQFKGIKIKNRDEIIDGNTCIICSGTFLRGLCHTGQKHWESGRFDEPPSISLSDSLHNLGFPLFRLKTGTPPRIEKDSIDFSKMEIQHSDEEEWFFSYRVTERQNPQQPCYRLYTNSETHKIINSRITESPMFNGTIKSTGPRYCPSIEDKIYRFENRDRHPLIMEPEGINHPWMYLNGFSSSLPGETQLEALHTISGCENARIGRYAYAIEYDAVPSRELKRTLETRRINNLYLAGQICGTSGYEEAGVQGLIAGTNAALKAKNEKEFFFNRSESYTGVLIDDLVTLEIEEPYRMFTSRAEYRLLLRQDNAEERLYKKAYVAGLISKERFESIDEKINSKNDLINFFKSFRIPVNTIVNEGKDLTKHESIAQLLRRPEIKLYDLIEKLDGQIEHKLPSDPSILKATEIELHYEGYLERQQREIEKLKNQENRTIPADFDYNSIIALSAEARLKLNNFRPETLGQASRLAGVTPSDLAVLLIHLKRYSFQ